MTGVEASKEAEKAKKADLNGDVMKMIGGLFGSYSSSAFAEQSGTAKMDKDGCAMLTILSQFAENNKLREALEKILGKLRASEPEEFDRLIEEFQRENNVDLLAEWDKFEKNLFESLDKYKVDPDVMEEILSDISTGRPQDL